MLIKYIIFAYIFLNIYFPNAALTKEIWLLDKKLSTINFELPIFLVKNIHGKFNNINGLIELDFNKKKNKAIFSVNIDSIEINYKNYKDILLSNIFFHKKKFPIALIDTKQFTYKNEKELSLIVDLTIKDITKKIPLEIEIIHLAEKIVQVKGKFIISRTDFKLGKGKWSSTKILKNNVSVKLNLFLFRN